MSSTVSEPHSPVAVITGAAQGIGRAIAQALAAKGYLLALGDIPSKENELQTVVSECTEIQRNTISPGFISKILPVLCDVTKESQVEALVQTAVSELGGIDVMVANAGIFRAGLLLDVPDEDFDQIHAVNVKGLFYSYRAAARAMIARGTGGRIIGACSRAGKQGVPEAGAYVASKFAVRGLTQTAAREWGKYGITVNAYAPGPVNTEMWNVNVDNLEAYRGVTASIPTGQITSPEEVAGLVTFLTSPAAKNITGESQLTTPNVAIMLLTQCYIGQAISINGGLFMD
ncbi:Enoyl-(Acyl carrier protein) reductase [Ceratobasidium sp. AG-Ba]|nr:Enoyl-(Acyl carrier protein) reductase [Ceratobasidium sp. AG-Ba]